MGTEVCVLFIMLGFCSLLGEQLNFVSNALLVLYYQWDLLDSVYQYNWNFSNLEVSYYSIVFHFLFDYDGGCIILKYYSIVFAILI